MSIDAVTALWFAPFALPICIYVAFTDMRDMRIANGSVLLLAAVFALVGPIALPLDVYAWRWAHLLIVLIAGITLNALGAVGAGDAKFTAAAAPFIDLGDLPFLVALLAATVTAALVTHRGAMRTPLRHLAPEWQSWHSGHEFPMGLALGGTLGLYLLAGAFWGA